MVRLGLLKTLPGSPSRAVKDLVFMIEANGSSAFNLDSPVQASREKHDPRAEKAFGLAFKVEPSERNRLLDLARDAFTEDWELEDSAFAEKGRRQPGFFHLLLDGLNTVEAYFYKYSNPEQFGSINQEEISQYGPVISRYYEYYDQIIGKYLASLKDNDLLVVYSSFGVEPLPLWKRFVEWILGNPDVSAYHEDTPAGVVFFFGNGIEKRNTVEGMKIVDIAPTILYYLGLPVGKDMDGIVQSPVFVREFTAENPIFYIGSYEETEIKSR
jgi:arylsulfatase A-like enzyme